MAERLAVMATYLSEHVLRSSFAKCKANTIYHEFFLQRLSILNNGSVNNNNYFNNLNEDELKFEINSFLQNCQNILEVDKNRLEKALEFTTESILKRVHVFRINDQTELIALINQLPSYLTSIENVKLIIIDSIAFHFRMDFQDISIRNKILANISQTLHNLAFRNQLSVVVVNHVTTKLDKSSSTIASTNIAQSTNSGFEVPALGDQWFYCINNRIYLSYDNIKLTDLTNIKRNAILRKSSYR